MDIQLILSEVSNVPDLFIQERVLYDGLKNLPADTNNLTPKDIEALFKASNSDVVSRIRSNMGQTITLKSIETQVRVATAYTTDKEEDYFV